MNNLQISDSGTFAELKETSKVLQKLQASEEAVSSNASDSDDDSKFCHQVSGIARRVFKIFEIGMTSNR